MSLSVIVITRNEEAAIRRCLDSVAWAQQRVVVDHGSTDRTVEIARAAGAQVQLTPDWPGFGPQKNRALALAQCEWVLSLDADEWLSPALAEEMRAAIRDPAAPAAYSLPRRSSYCGRYMRHSGWWPDYVARLFRRGRARFSDDLIHERLVVDGPLGRLRGELMHEAFTDLEEVLRKVDRYSTWSAQALAERGARGGLAIAASRGLWSFLRTYLLRAGFLDGREGFMLAVSNAEGTYYKYLKLMLRQRKP
jgi:glycosyltransferase involved in cell wall biosynthesis